MSMKKRILFVDDDAQVLQGNQLALQDRLDALASLEAEARHLARAGVVDQACRDARQLVLVLLDVGLRAVETLFLAGEQDEANCPLRRGQLGRP